MYANVIPSRKRERPVVARMYANVIPSRKRERPVVTAVSVAQYSLIIVGSAYFTLGTGSVTNLAD
jgi:hypothetical protein